MSENTKIQWTDHTWNPWHGCKKVSAGCKFCYMYRDKERYKKDPTVVLRSKTGFYAPLQWKDAARVFTCSWSDWFIEEADSWRAEAWAIIKATPHLTYQILTKRSDRIAAHLPADWGENGYPNVWLGVSVENQDAANERIPFLLTLPAIVRFLSCEPLLGPLKLISSDEGVLIGPMVVKSGGLQPSTVNYPAEGYDDSYSGIDWVIIGGESGNETGNYRYRPCEVDWMLSIMDQCKSASVPVFVKQMGTYISKQQGLHDRHGGDMEEWMLQLRTRQFPAQLEKELL